jgi:hypothetical protein
VKSRIANAKLRISTCVVLLIVVTGAPVWAYVTSRMTSANGTAVQQRWAPGFFPIQWQMNPTRGANITGTPEQADIFRQSFASWQALSTASIAFAEGAPTAATTKPGYDAVNLVSTFLTQAEFDALGANALAVTVVSSAAEGGFVDQFNRPVDFAGQILDADIVFNPSILFSTNSVTPADRIDLQSVATHEIGHLLGLDHTTLLSSVMFPTVIVGANFPRTLSTDDMAGVSTLYPSGQFGSKGTITGTVRTTSNAAVYGAIVTAVNGSGQPVASAITDATGKYTIAGLDSGPYTIYAEPMDGPIVKANIKSLDVLNPGLAAFQNFTTRFR